MLNQIISNEFFWVFFLTIYVGGVFLLTKHFYEWMMKKQIKKEVAMYYNRKIIHILAGGVIVIAVPFVFSNPWYPLLAGIVLTIFTYFTHKKGNILYWFQTKDNINDVTFCFMWGLTIFLLWQILGNPWIAIIPPAFIAFGDGITGIVRNFAFKERRKHMIGNIYMMGVCIPIGYFFANAGEPSIPLWGVIAAIVASLFERYEFGKIDDNILVTVIATIILYIGGIIGPIA
jgi:phytol kinase